MEGLDVGMDTLSRVGKTCAGQSPFAFTRRIGKVHFEFGHGLEQSPAEKLQQKLTMD